MIPLGASANNCLNGGEISCNSEDVSTVWGAGYMLADDYCLRLAWLSHSAAKWRRQSGVLYHLVVHATNCGRNLRCY